MVSGTKSSATRPASQAPSESETALCKTSLVLREPPKWLRFFPVKSPDMGYTQDTPPYFPCKACFYKSITCSLSKQLGRRQMGFLQLRARCRSVFGQGLLAACTQNPLGPFHPVLNKTCLSLPHQKEVKLKLSNRLTCIHQRSFFGPLNLDADVSGCVFVHANGFIGGNSWLGCS